MNASVFVFLICLIGIGLSADEVNTKLRFYYSSIDHFTELSLEEAQNIFAISWYNSSKNTVIFAHGFTGHPTGPAVTEIISAYLEQGRNNVILLNWEQMAAATQANLANSYLNWAAPNARMLGAVFAETLLNLSKAGLDLNRTHLVGHSLGAHIFGIAGNNLQAKGINLSWITGLDPASLGFEGRPLSSRLYAGSARFVSVIHSDPNKYGYKTSLGTVDFWPNFRNVGPVRQPGCDRGPHTMFSPEDLCNHNRCWKYWIDAIKYPGSLIGSYAKNYRMWKNYFEEERTNVVLDMMEYNENVVPGNYYLVTNSESPFGLGLKGL